MGTLKFRCDRDALSEALQTVQRGVSSRPGIPALTGVLLDVAEEGRLTLTTTDLEVSARLIVNRVALKLHAERLRVLIDVLRRTVPPPPERGR